jgi:hypothetical protein
MVMCNYSVFSLCILQNRDEDIVSVFRFLIYFLNDEEEGDVCGDSEKRN